jgi:hypothetical protein
MKYIITERQYKEFILNEDSSDCRSDFEKKIKNVVRSIFKKTIDDILEPHKTEWNGNREKYVKILKLIGKSDNDIKNILDMKFVYHEDGSWSRINKLNTNYSDLSVLISDILEDEGDDLCNLLDRYNEGDKSFLTDLAQVMSLDPERYFDDYLKPKEDRYIQNNTKNSKVGDAAELKVIQFIKSLGGELIYQSTEGSPIDTRLGIDVIMMSPDGVLMKIQVKNVNSIKLVDQTPCEKKSEIPFKNKKKSGGYLIYTTNGVPIRPENINFVAYVSKDKVIICKNYSPVSVINQKCIDEPSYNFPSNPKKGYFVVDHESVEYTNT